MTSNPHHIVRHPMAHAGYFRPRARGGAWGTGYKHPLWDLALKAATPDELYDSGTPDRKMATRFLDLNLNEDQLSAIWASRSKYHKNKKTYVTPPNAIFEKEDWNLQEAMSEMIQWQEIGGPLHFNLTTPEERLYYAKEATSTYDNSYKRAQKYLDTLAKIEKSGGKLTCWGKRRPKGIDPEWLATSLRLSDHEAADIIKVWSKAKAQALIETFLRRYSQ